jgi:hypothetical protein
LTNTENLSMGPHAFLALDGVVGGSSVGFAQSGGDTLCLETPAMFGGVLSALGEGDTIQLADIHATSLAFANGLLSLLGSTGDTLTTLRFADNYPPSDFHLEGIAGGTQINFSLAPY